MLFRQVRSRVEIGLSAVAAAAAIATLADHDWIEAVFHVSPDRGNGWAEWLITASLFAVSALFLLLGLRSLRLSGQH